LGTSDCSHGEDKERPQNKRVCPASRTGVGKFDLGK